MKKIIISALSLAALTGSAVAADLPSRKAAPAYVPPAAPMWTGFHVGLNAGGTWGNNSSLSTTTWPMNNFVATQPVYWAYGNTALPGSSNGGFIGGGQVGYDWQVPFNGMGFVTGVEADIQGIAASGGNRNANFVTPGSGAGETVWSNVNASGNLQYLGTVRGRLGYLVTPTLLVYGTGGLAYGGVSFNVSNTRTESGAAGTNWIALGNASYSNTQVGWTGGGGAEWMFMPNWSAKVEYLYYDLGNVSMTGVTTRIPVQQTQYPANTWTSSTYNGRINGNLIRAGVNYHFNFASAPVVAKY